MVGVLGVFVMRTREELEEGFLPPEQEEERCEEAYDCYRGDDYACYCAF